MSGADDRNLVGFSDEDDLFNDVLEERAPKPVSSLTYCDRSEVCHVSVKANHSYFCLNDPGNCPVKRT